MGCVTLVERFPAGLNRAVFPTRWKCDSRGAPNSEAARDGALVGGFAQAGGFGGSRGRHELPCGGAAVRVGFSSAIRWVAALRERGSYAPLPMGGDTRSQRVEAHTDFLLRLHRREPDLTLDRDLRPSGARATREQVSPSMIWRFFDRHDITFKKSPRTRASRIARTSLQRRRRMVSTAQLDLDPLKLVFVDETGGDDQHGAPLRPPSARSTSAPRRSAWPLQSDHLCIRPASERRRRAQGLRPRPERRDASKPRLEHHLLRLWKKGDIVVLDNLNVHKSPRVAEILAQKNCTVRYLPPYSPDFNPIEMVISKLKSALRKFGRAHRCRPSCYPGGLRRSLQAGRMRKLLRGLRV